MSTAIHETASDFLRSLQGDFDPSRGDFVLGSTAHGSGSEIWDIGRAKILNSPELLATLAIGWERARSEQPDNPQTSDSPAGSAEPVSSESDSRPIRRRAKHVNVRMLETLSKRPESHTWTKRKWATCLNCSDGTVSGTRTWKMLVAAREQSRNERRQITPRRNEL